MNFENGGSINFTGKFTTTGTVGVYFSGAGHVLDCNYNSITGAAANTGIFVYSTSTDSSISNCNISSYSYGIDTNANSLDVSNTNATSCYWALWLHGGSGDTITNSRFEGTSMGMYSQVQTGATIANNYFASTGGYGAVGVYGLSTSNISNNTMNATGGVEALDLSIGGTVTGNQFINNTFLTDGATTLVLIPAGVSGNTFYWNNFTATTQKYVNDANGGNFYNSSSEGNIWFDVMNLSIPYEGSSASSGFPNLYISSGGASLPYNSSVSSKAVKVKDWYPLTPTAGAAPPAGGNITNITSILVIPNPVNHTQNVSCNITATDTALSTFNITNGSWLKNGVVLLNFTFTDIANNTMTTVANLTTGNYTIGDNISCQAIATGSNVSALIIATNVTIGNGTAPPAGVSAITSITVAPNPAYKTTNLTCNITATDSALSTLNITNGSWTKNGTVILNFTFNNIANNTNTVVSNLTTDNFSKGDNISCQAIASGSSISSMAYATNVTIGNTAPASPSVGNFIDASIEHWFTVNGTVYDEDGGTDITSSNLTIDIGSCSVISNSSNGNYFYKKWNCTNTYEYAPTITIGFTDNDGAYVQASNTHDYPDHAPTLTKPTITPSILYVNSLATVVNGTWSDPDGDLEDPASILYTWYVNGGTFGTGDTFDLTGSAVKGDNITVSQQSLAINWTTISDVTETSLATMVSNSNVSISANTSYADYSTTHQFNATASATDEDGAADITASNITISAGSCAKANNSTSGNTFTQTFTCTGTAPGTPLVSIGFTDSTGAYVQTSTTTHAYPDHAASLTVPSTTTPLYVNSTATCSPGTFSDIDGDTENTGARTWKWYKNGTEQAGQTASTLVLSAVSAIKGDNISCYESTIAATWTSSTAANASTNVTVSNLAPTIAYSLSFSNSANTHSFLTSAGVIDVDGASDINFTNITVDLGSCVYVNNSTSGNYFNVTYNCTSTTPGIANIIIGFKDKSSTYIGTAQAPNTYPDHAAALTVPSVNTPLYITSTATCTAGTFSDIDSDTENTTLRVFTWYQNGTNVSTGTTLDLTTVSAVAGDNISCREDSVANNWTTSTAWNISTNVTISSAPLTFHPPNITAISLVPTTAYKNSTLSCNITAIDDVDTSLTLYFNWFKNGVNQTALAGSTTIGNNSATLVSNLTLSFNASDNWSCSGMAFDSVNYSSWNYSSNVTILNRNISLAYNITFSNYSTSHQFNVTAGALDEDGATDITTFNITTSTGSCTYLSNSSVGNYKNVTYNCSSLIPATADIVVGFTDSQGSYIQTASASNDFPDHNASLTQPTITPNPAYTNSLLTCNVGSFSDIDSDTENASARAYNWYKNGVIISTGATLNVSGLVNVSDNISCRENVTANNWTASTATNISNNITISNTVPTVAVQSIFINSTNNHTFNVTAGFYDLDGFPSPGDTNNISTTAGSCVQISNNTVGSYFNVTYKCTPTGPATPTIVIGFTDRNGGYVQTTSAANAYPDHAASVTQPTLNSPLYANSTATCTAGTYSDLDNDTENVSSRVFTWYVNGISVGTGATYVLTSRPVLGGDNLSCSENVTNSTWTQSWAWNMSSNVTVGKLNDSINLTLNGSAANISYTFSPTFTLTAAASASSGLTTSITLNGTAISNPNSQVLGVGYWNYTATTAGSSSYNAANATLFANVTKATNNVNVYINGTEGNLSYVFSPTFSLTITSNATNGTPSIYLNGTLVANPYSGVLGVGYYNITVNSTDNQNWTDSTKTFFVNVTKASNNINLYLNNAQANISYVFSQILYLNSSANATNGTVSLYLNGTLISNPNSTILGVGYWNYTANSTDNQNWTGNSITLFANVSKTNTTTTISSQNGWNFTYGIQTNISCVASNPEVLVILYQNGTQVNNSTGGTVWYNTTLGVNTYFFECNASASQNYSSGTSNNTLNITKVLNNINLYLNGSQSNISYVYDPLFALNVSSNSTNGTPSLYRNGTLISNPNSTILAAGYYNFTANSSNNQNWTGQIISYFANVSKATPTISLSSQGGWSFLNGTLTNVSCSISTNQSFFALYFNGTQVANSTANGSILWDNQTIANGNYTYWCNSTESENYTAASATNVMRIASNLSSLFTQGNSAETQSAIAELNQNVSWYVNIYVNGSGVCNYTVLRPDITGVFVVYNNSSGVVTTSGTYPNILWNCSGINAPYSINFTTSPIYANNMSVNSPIGDNSVFFNLTAPSTQAISYYFRNSFPANSELQTLWKCSFNTLLECNYSNASAYVSQNFTNVVTNNTMVIQSQFASTSLNSFFIVTSKYTSNTGTNPGGPAGTVVGGGNVTNETNETVSISVDEPLFSAPPLILGSIVIDYSKPVSSILLAFKNVSNIIADSQSMSKIVMGFKNMTDFIRLLENILFYLLIIALIILIYITRKDFPKTCLILIILLILLIVIRYGSYGGNYINPLTPSTNVSVNETMNVTINETMNETLPYNRPPLNIIGVEWNYSRPISYMMIAADNVKNVFKLLDGALLAIISIVALVVAYIFKNDHPRVSVCIVFVLMLLMIVRFG